MSYIPVVIPRDFRQPWCWGMILLDTGEAVLNNENSHVEP